MADKHGKAKYRAHFCAGKDTTFIAQYVPARKEELRSALLRNTEIFGWPDDEYPFVLFRISNKNKKPATQIILEINALGE